MTDTSNSLPGEEPTAFGAPGSQETAPGAPSIDELPTVMVGPGVAGEMALFAPMEAAADASTVIITPAPLETVTYIPPAEAEPATLVLPSEAILPTVAAPDYEAYRADLSAVPPQYAPLQGTVQAGPYPAPSLPDGQPGYYAGAYPQPGWTGAPVPSARKPRRGWLVLAIVLIVLLVSGGTVFAIVATRGPANTPTQVLQQYCAAYQAYNAQGIYNTLDAAGQSSTSVSQLQQTFDALKGFVTISSCKVSNVQQNGSRASGTITITESISLLGISTSTSVPQSMGLLVENNLWKVDLSATKTSPGTEPTFTLPGLQTPTNTGSNQ